MMDLEERARLWLADYFDKYGKHGGADELRDGRIISLSSIVVERAMAKYAAEREAAAYAKAIKGAAEVARDAYSGSGEIGDFAEGYDCAAGGILRAIEALGEKMDG